MRLHYKNAKKFNKQKALKHNVSVLPPTVDRTKNSPEKKYTSVGKPPKKMKYYGKIFIRLRRIFISKVSRQNILIICNYR